MELFEDLLFLIPYTGTIIFFMMFRNPRMLDEKDDRIYDAVMVCGYPAEDDGTPSDIMKSRIGTGISLYKKKKVRKLLLSGGPVKNAFAEAHVMKAYAMNHGVPEEDIYVEDRAGSTYANMKLSLPIIRQHQIHSILVVTNDWHLRKADHYARKLKTEYAMVAAERPEKEGILKNLWLHIWTNVTVFYNLWKGLY